MNSLLEILTRPRLIGVTPTVACSDLAASLEFYRHTLGFQRRWARAESEREAVVGRDGVGLVLVQDAGLARCSAGSEIVLWVEDVAALYEEHRYHGALVIAALEEKPWGSHEYSIADPAGYLLRFSSPVADGTGCGNTLFQPS